jgi:sulfofructose kinase
MGEEGSAGLAEDGSLVVAPAFRIDVVDSTGAGDVFHGAFLFALLQGQGMRDALAFANAAAALSCRAVGGHPGCPALEHVQALLHARGGSP